MSDMKELRQLTADLLKSEQEKDLIAEKIQKENEALYQWIEKSSDGIWDWHLDKDYEYMSPRFWEIFGYEPHEKKHHPSAWQDMIFKEDLEEALDIFGKHVASKGKVPYKLDVRYRHKLGHTIKILCRGEVVEWNEDGSPKRMLGLHTDITDIAKDDDK